MVKTTGPLLSADAHGSIADVLTFSHRKSGKQVRNYTKPVKIPSAKQRGQRRLTEFLVAQWQNMSDADKATWATRAKASGMNVAGYHYFLREAQRDLYTHHGLCGYWHCNEIVAGKVLDISGKDNHGTLLPSYPSDAPTLVKSRTRKFGNALLYNGSSDIVDCGLGASLDLRGDMTFICWIHPTTLVATYVIASKSGGSNSTMQWEMRSTGTTLRFLASNGTSNFPADISGLKLNTWQQVGGTIISNRLRVYRDAIEVVGPLLTGTKSTTTQHTAFACRRPSSPVYRYPGIQDEACLYNRGLSHGEFITRYKLARRDAPR